MPVSSLSYQLCWPACTRLRSWLTMTLLQKQMLQCGVGCKQLKAGSKHAFTREPQT